MSHYKQNIKILIGSLAIVTASCGKNAASSRSMKSAVPFGTQANQDAKSKGSEGASGGGSELSLAPLGPKIGVRNYNQVVESMLVLTGLSPANTNVSNAIKSFQLALPDSNDPEAAGAANMIAMLKLVSVGCVELFADPVKRKAFLPKVDFTKAPSVVFTNAAKIDIAQTFYRKFYGTGRKNLPDAAVSDAIGVGLITEILSDKNLSTTTLTPSVIAAVCTAYLASSSVNLMQ